MVSLCKVAAHMGAGLSAFAHAQKMSRGNPSNRQRALLCLSCMLSRPNTMLLSLCAPL